MKIMEAIKEVIDVLWVLFVLGIIGVFVSILMIWHGIEYFWED